MLHSKGFRVFQLPRISIIGGAVLWVAGCAHRPESMPTPKSVRRTPCEVLTPVPAVPAESLHIAVTDPLRSDHAPTPHSNAERLIFPLLYSGTASPVCGNAEPSARIGSVDSGALNSAPVVIRSTDLVTTPWPAPTGPFGIGDATDTTLDLLPRAPRSQPRIHISEVAPRQGRDALDEGVDVLVTSDAKTIAYAAAQPDLMSVPLSWDKVYVLIEPGVRVKDNRDSIFAVKTDLAKYALRVEARPADDSATLELMACPTLGLDAKAGASGVMPSQPSANRVVYEAGDDVARGLSERLVALVAEHKLRLAALEQNGNSGRSIRAAGLDSASFREALEEANEAAYVIALPLDHLTGCDAVGALKWYARGLFPRSNSPLDNVTPLVETRARAIVRRGRVGLSADSGGTVSLEFRPALGS